MHTIQNLLLLWLLFKSVLFALFRIVKLYMYKKETNRHIALVGQKLKEPAGFLPDFANGIPVLWDFSFCLSMLWLLWVLGPPNTCSKDGLLRILGTHARTSRSHLLAEANCPFQLNKSTKKGSPLQECRFFFCGHWATGAAFLLRPSMDHKRNGGKSCGGFMLVEKGS